jgi:hypothetical protein
MDKVHVYVPWIGRQGHSYSGDRRIILFQDQKTRRAQERDTSAGWTCGFSYGIAGRFWLNGFQLLGIQQGMNGNEMIYKYTSGRPDNVNATIR